jgi:hypothetical protein
MTELPQFQSTNPQPANGGMHFHRLSTIFYLHNRALPVTSLAGGEMLDSKL